MTGSFFVTIKDVKTKKPAFKARFVVYGSCDNDNDELVHDCAAVCQSSVRLLIAMAAIIGFDVWTEDI